MELTIEELQEKINSLESEIEDLKSELISAQQDAQDKEFIIDDLKDELSLAQKNSADQEIDCGIGTIYYKEPDNLRRSRFMDALASQIQEHGIESVNL